MKLIKQSYEILTEINGVLILKNIEYIARTSTLTYDLITEDSYKTLIVNLLKREHFSVFENFSISVKWCTSRAILDEIRTHRIASHIMSSTRYCNYSKDRFNNQLTFCSPSYINDDDISILWKSYMLLAEKNYFALLKKGWKAEQARGVLPLDIYSEMVTTMNLRTWMNFFELRCDKTTHSELRKLTIPLLKEFQNKIPYVFDKLTSKYDVV
jgi:thymidylate synthase (FAD)